MYSEAEYDQDSTTLGLSESLTRFVRTFDLSALRDKVVVAVSPEHMPDWYARPTVWHNHSGTITVNLGRIYHAVRCPEVDRTILSQICDLLDGRAQSLTHDRYETWLKDGYLNPRPVSSTHKNLNKFTTTTVSGTKHERKETALRIEACLRAVIAREAYYDVTNQHIIESDWFKQDFNEYQRNIIRVLEETRMDYQAIARIVADRYTDSFSRTVNDNSVGQSQWSKAAVIAAMLLRPNSQIISEMSMPNADGEISIPRFALYSTMILGTPENFIYPSEKIEEFVDQLDTILGTERTQAMMRLLDRYLHAADPQESFIRTVITEWEELFPADPSGSTTDSSMINPDNSDGDESGDSTAAEQSGIGSEPESGDPHHEDIPDNAQVDDEYLNDIPEFEHETDQHGTRGGMLKSYGSTSTRIENDDTDPGRLDERIILPGVAQHLDELVGSEKPMQDAIEGRLERRPLQIRTENPRTSYRHAVHRYQSHPGIERTEAIARGREIEPSNTDRKAGKTLGHILRQLNVRDRGKFHTPDRLPPGRLDSRAALQQAAERDLRLPPMAQPWQRTKHTIDLNPPITVGIMTDVSGSMGWAEALTARLAWVLQHAVSQVNGTVAALAFGDGVTITLRPQEYLTNAQVIKANGSGEEFDYGMGTMDVLLNLEHGVGVRMLFVITDGQFGRKNMMHKTHQWIQRLTQRGVVVVWITPLPDTEHCGTMHDMPYTPVSVIHVSAEKIRESLKDGGHYSSDTGVWHNIIDPKPNCVTCQSLAENHDKVVMDMIHDLGHRLTRAVQSMKSRR